MCGKKENSMTISSKPISKILVAMDGSDKSTEASQYAISLAKKNRAKLLVLNVINTQPWFYSSTPYGWATPEKMENVQKIVRCLKRGVVAMILSIF
jgi:nucleotide-binding universal stress UspA family protein